MSWLKLKVFGRKAVVPTSITDETSDSGSSGGVRNNMAYASGTRSNVIPNRVVASNRGKYTAPPKATPWVYIPDGVCKDC